MSYQMQQAADDQQNLNLERICRCCLIERTNMKSIFDAGLPQMLMACANVTIDTTDGLPSLICFQCVQQINLAYTFRQQCERSDTMLRMFQPPIVSLPIQEDVQANDTHAVKFINVLLHQRDASDKSTIMLPIDENNQIQLIDGGAVFLTNHENGTGGDATTTASVLRLHNDDQDVDAMDGHNITAVDNGDDLQKPRHNDGGGSSFSDDREASDGNSSDELIDVGFLSDERMPVIPEAYMELMNDYEEPPPTLLNEIESTDVVTQTQPIAVENIVNVAPSHRSSFACDVCTKKFKSSTTLRRHKLNVHISPKQFFCQYCNKSFTDRSYLDKHQRRHTNDKSYECSVCSASFYARSILAIHERIHTGERPYKCEHCDKSFVQSSQLDAHRRSHDPERHYVCEICGKGFTLKWHLNVHMRTHTGDRPFACNICNKKFTQSGNLKIHRLVHSAEKQFQCTDCTKAFATHVQLRSHRRQHTGERLLPKATCTDCGKKFTNNGELKVHMRQHTGERPFSCVTCDRRFLMHTHLQVHMRTHTGERPYKCTTCTKCFSSSTILQKHLWIHTGEKRYACRHCGKRFTQSSGRNAHERIHDKQAAATAAEDAVNGGSNEAAGVEVESAMGGKYEM